MSFYVSNDAGQLARVPTSCHHGGVIAIDKFWSLCPLKPRHFEKLFGDEEYFAPSDDKELRLYAIAAAHFSDSLRVLYGAPLLCETTNLVDYLSHALDLPLSHRSTSSIHSLIAKPAVFSYLLQMPLPRGHPTQRDSGIATRSSFVQFRGQSHATQIASEQHIASSHLYWPTSCTILELCPWLRGRILPTMCCTTEQFVEIASKMTPSARYSLIARRLVLRTLLNHAPTAWASCFNDIASAIAPKQQAQQVSGAIHVWNH